MMIGKLSEKSGVSIETIRFYEHKGLIEPVSRKATGYRVYNEDSLERLRFIKRSKELGFSLEEISDLLSMRIKNKSQCNRVRTKAKEKLEDVQTKIEDLRHIATSLKKLIHTCESQNKTNNCPILENLEGKIG